MGHTLSAPINPNTLKIFAKCKYTPKFEARWYGSSGSCANNNEERMLEVRVARATVNVTVLCKQFLLAFSSHTFISSLTTDRDLAKPMMV